MSSSKAKWLTLIVVVFIIGGALGFLGGQSYQRYMSHKLHASNQPPPPNQRSRSDFQKRLLDELKKDLGLSDEQTKKITDIFNQVDKKNQEDRVKRQADREQRMQNDIKTGMGFSEEQAKKVMDILSGIDKKNQADRDQRITSMREEVDKQISAVLNPEQKVKFVEFQKRFNQDRAPRDRRWGQDTTSPSRDTTLKKGK